MSLYTNTMAVRREAGLQNNVYITNENIDEKIAQAESEINSSLSIASYSLPLDTVPKVITNAANLLAAGYILVQDYGPMHEGTNKDGQKKIDMARAILKQIEGREIQLLDTSSVPLAQSSRIRGYPDNSAADESPSEDRMFRVTDVF